MVESRQSVSVGHTGPVGSQVETFDLVFMEGWLCPGQGCGCAWFIAGLVHGTCPMAGGHPLTTGRHQPPMPARAEEKPSRRARYSTVLNSKSDPVSSHKPRNENFSKLSPRESLLGEKQILGGEGGARICSL